MFKEKQIKMKKMKFINLFILFIMFQSCDSAKVDKKNYANTFVYETLSRGGSFEYVKLSQNEILISTEKNLEKTQAYKVDENDWIEVNKLLEKIDLNTLKNLKAPTSKRLYDGAPHATFMVEDNKTEYKTSTFDGGFPPKEIEAIVNKILSMKDKIN